MSGAPNTTTDYARFIVLSAPRTGSHMLAQALHSHPQIICFREVFNGLLDFIQFGVEGYDDFSTQDMALRKEDPVRFLRERIFCEQPSAVRAVGFKYHYRQVWAFPGVLQALAGDRELRVLHLRRRNFLRTLISLKLAQSTGVWVRDGRGRFTGGNVRTALRHPLKAAGRLGRRLRPPPKALPGAPRRQVTVSRDELFQFIVRTKRAAARFDELFREHPMLTLCYEDVVERWDEVLDQAQSFLGVEPQPLTVTLRRQHPEPLRDLVANYDELYEAYRYTPQAALFE